MISHGVDFYPVMNIYLYNHNRREIDSAKSGRHLVLGVYGGRGERVIYMVLAKRRNFCLGAVEF